MALTITIKGSGTVDKVVDGISITLTATPNNEWSFKYFLIGSDTVTDNPYTSDFIDIAEVIATFYMSIESYLKGKIGFVITDSAISAILTDRGIEANADINDLTEKQRELLYADVLIWGATLPTTYSGAKDSDGGWTHTGETSTIQQGDKTRFENIANAIYAKYNDKRKAKSEIKLINLNGFYRR